MEEHSLVGMFDSFWFNHEIFRTYPYPINPEKNLDEKIPKTSTKSLPTSSVESMEGLGLASSSIESIENHLSPCSVLPAEKLQTIFSGKQMRDEEEEDLDENPFKNRDEEEKTPKAVAEKLKQIRRREEEEMRRSKRNMLTRMKKRGLTKSLTDLEFEEIKGFEELGFVFSEEDKNSSFLASILPGLQRLGREEERQPRKIEQEDGIEGEGKRSKSVERSGVSRPYLSEVWWDDSAFSEGDRRLKKENLPLNLRPEILPVRREMDMKHYLRNWAHSVAASVR